MLLGLLLLLHQVVESTLVAGMGWGKRRAWDDGISATQAAIAIVVTRSAAATAFFRVKRSNLDGISRQAVGDGRPSTVPA